METEIISTEKIDLPANLEELGITIDQNFINQYVNDAIKAYMDFKLPIIAVLELKRIKNSPDYHAVVISGYRTGENGIIKQLYVHDDQLGPYTRVQSARKDNGFVYWDYELKRNYNQIHLFELIIPLYSKLRLTFSNIYIEFLKVKSKMKEGITAHIFLTELNDYKEFLLSRDFENKRYILTGFFPKYLWVIRIQIKGEPLADYLYDATAVYTNKICSILFY
ncbi:MAG: hypothetical protein SCH66_11125 [Methanolobus sp.]|nr:hypothetical protein [Methanolobus sp.]